MKTCTKCGEPKSPTEFSKAVRNSDGLQSYCKACDKIVGAEYRAANPEKGRSRSAKYNATNPEKVKANRAALRSANPGRETATRAAYRAANQDKIKASVAKYQAANLESRRIYAQNRRARKSANGGRLSVGITEKLFTLQRGKCACCKTPLGDKYHRDHYIPLALDGPNEDWNMQLLCVPCNLQKGARHPVEFMQQKGFLI